MQVANLENIAYHYICRNPVLFRSAEREFFRSNVYIAGAYELTKKWYVDFGKIPFDPTNAHSDQLKEVARNEIVNLKLDPNKKLEENLDSLLNTIELLIGFDYSRYNADWSKQVVEGWIMWEKFQEGMKKSIKYQQSVKITPENTSEIIANCKNIITNSAHLTFDSDDGVDFMDTEAHRQMMPSELYQCKNHIINQWKGGGFEPGTLTHLWGASNTGKSIFLANFALDFFTAGYNVLLFSLEMSTHKIIKRIAANAFDIPMDKYSDLSQDSTYVGGLMSTFRDQQMTVVIQ